MNGFKLCIVAIAVLISMDAISQKSKTATVQPDVSKDKVMAEIARLSLLSGGIVGLAAIHIETGKRLVQNDLDAFPMASSYKVPIAIELLTKVDSGNYTID